MMNRQEFECDTSECRYWDEEDGCQKQTPIIIQEHCCCDFEEKAQNSICIEVKGGIVQNVYSTVSDQELGVELLDFDNAQAESSEDVETLAARLKVIKKNCHNIFFN